MQKWGQAAILEHLGTTKSLAELQKGLHGIERETLRVNRDGTLALTPHPKNLSDPLSDPHITTDFSESQLELITSPHKSAESALDELNQIHKKVVKGLQNDELIWPGSMPCILPEAEKIPVAEYGESDGAKTKEIYRRGLALRYGKYVQMLCGVHYNVSFSEDLWENLFAAFGDEKSLQDFKNNRSMGLVRNFIRHRWILVYLLGVTPVKHETYQCKNMSKFCPKKAIAFRLSQCGYHNPKAVKIDYNSFENHLQSVDEATQKPYPPYTKLGLEKDGTQQQLNDHLLQIANEYYFPIRMKSAPHKDGFLAGLKQNGAAYVEIRLLDVDPVYPSGMDEKTLRMSHLFALFCWINESSEITEAEYKDAAKKQEFVAVNGRIELPDDYKSLGTTILQKIKKIADKMGSEYQETIDYFIEEFEKPKDLSWKKMLDTMEQEDQDFVKYNLSQAINHKKTFEDG